jgi:hypothetical protein
MFLSGFYLQSHAAVNTNLDTMPTSCDVFSADEEKKEGDKKKEGEEEEEEPDCE